MQAPMVIPWPQQYDEITFASHTLMIDRSLAIDFVNQRMAKDRTSIYKPKQLEAQIGDCGSGQKKSLNNPFKQKGKKEDDGFRSRKLAQ